MPTAAPGIGKRRGKRSQEGFGFKSPASTDDTASLLRQPGAVANGNSYSNLGTPAQQQIAAILQQSGCQWLPSLRVFLALGGFSFTLTRKQGSSESLPGITNGSGGQEGNQDDWLQN